MKDFCTCWWDSFLGVYYGDCCKTHDDAYEIGGNWKDRRFHDRMLQICVFHKFRNKKSWIRILGWVWSWLMWVGVRIGASYWFCRYVYPRRIDYQYFNWR